MGCPTKYIGPDKERIVCALKLHLFPYLSILTCVLGAQRSCLIETVLLSTHNICFGKFQKHTLIWRPGEISTAHKN